MVARWLELDVGNTAMKWRLLDGCRVDGGRRECSVASLRDLLSRWQPNAIRVASVAADDRNRLIQDAARRAGVPCQFAHSQARCGPVTNSYRDVGKMGVDRWLAMLAAWQLCRREVVVVDAGTALTIDIIDSSAQHLGGYILPGRKMMLDALLGNTDRVRYGEAPAPSVLPGRDTGACVENASWMSLLASIQSCHAGAFNSAQKPGLVICGGDAPQLIDMAGGAASDWLFRDELVLDGLAIALEQPGGEG